MTTEHSPDPESKKDQQLASALERLLDAQLRGGEVDVESEVADRPELANELRQLWAAVQVADVCALSWTDSVIPPEEALGAPRELPVSLAITNFWKKSVAAEWASSTRRGNPAWSERSP